MCTDLNVFFLHFFCLFVFFAFLFFNSARKSPPHDGQRGRQDEGGNAGYRAQARDRSDEEGTLVAVAAAVVVVVVALHWLA